MWGPSSILDLLAPTPLLSPALTRGTISLLTGKDGAEKSWPALVMGRTAAGGRRCHCKIWSVPLDPPKDPNAGEAAALRLHAQDLPIRRAGPVQHCCNVVATSRRLTPASAGRAMAS